MGPTLPDLQRFPKKILLRHLGDYGMRRREFIAGLGGAAAWPLTLLAQHDAIG
jgi:hypothetical protein